MEAPNLYPLSIGEILDRAFRLYRRNFGLLIGITLAAYVPMTVLLVISFNNYQVSTYIYLTQIGFVSLLVSGALTTGISRLYFGRSITMQEAYLGIGKRYVSAWVGFFFMALFSIGPVSILVLVIERFVWWIQGTWISYLMIFLSLAFIVYLGIRWRLMLPAILLETRKATEGLDRSWKLTHGIFWRVFGITFLVGTLVYLFSTLPQTVINYGLEFFSPGFSYASIALTIFSQSTLIFTSPFITAVNVVLFYDILVRKEGFDLNLQLGITPPPFPSEELIEKKEPDDYPQNPW